MKRNKNINGLTAVSVYKNMGKMKRLKGLSAYKT